MTLKLEEDFQEWVPICKNPSSQLCSGYLNSTTTRSQYLVKMYSVSKNIPIFTNFNENLTKILSKETFENYITKKMKFLDFTHFKGIDSKGH